MNKKHLENAFDQLSDRHIREAVDYKRPRILPYMSAIAACLVCAILLSVFAPKGPAPSLTENPTFSAQPALPSRPRPEVFGDTLTPITFTPASSSAMLCAPVYPQMAPYSVENYSDWKDTVLQIHQTEPGYAQNLKPFFQKLSSAALAEQYENAVFSPLNIYMALAMLAETADGESREQILNLLNAENLDSLRDQAEQLWRAHYYNDGLATSVLGSSLWLDEAYSYNEHTVKALAEYYYASVFRGDIGSAELDADLQQWINEHTGGLLKEQVSGIQLPDDGALAMVTTIYYQVQWQNKFFKNMNITGKFHGPTSDTQVTFMRDSEYYDYFRGNDFSAVALPLEDGSRMWLILPDQGTNPQGFLSDGSAMEMILSSDTSLYTSQFVRLCVPKFDVTADLDMINTLKTLGIKDVFSPEKANLSAIIPEKGAAYVNEFQHAARLTMDEDGISAAAYTLIVDTYRGLLDEPIELIFDRPFLFVVESADNLPLFVGTVYEP